MEDCFFFTVHSLLKEKYCGSSVPNSRRWFIERKLKYWKFKHFKIGFLFWSVCVSQKFIKCVASLFHTHKVSKNINKCRQNTMIGNVLYKLYGTLNLNLQMLKNNTIYLFYICLYSCYFIKKIWGKNYPALRSIRLYGSKPCRSFDYPFYSVRYCI